MIAINYNLRHSLFILLAIICTRDLALNLNANNYPVLNRILIVVKWILIFYFVLIILIYLVNLNYRQEENLVQVNESSLPLEINEFETIYERWLRYMERVQLNEEQRNGKIQKTNNYTQKLIEGSYARKLIDELINKGYSLTELKQKGVFESIERISQFMLDEYYEYILNSIVDCPYVLESFKSDSIITDLERLKYNEDQKSNYSALIENIHSWINFSSNRFITFNMIDCWNKSYTFIYSIMNIISFCNIIFWMVQCIYES
jgi:hypothetical protein